MGNWEEREEHTEYRIFSCPVCESITLVESYWNDEMEEQMAEEFCEKDKILYPNIIDEYSDVTIKINNAFKSAVRSRYLDFTLCMIALRRTLEMICIDKGVTKGMLGKKLKEMESKGLIPTVINEASQILKNLGNAAAHGEEITYTSAQVKEAFYFIDSIINYIYVLPEKIKKLQSTNQV